MTDPADTRTPPVAGQGVHPDAAWTTATMAGTNGEVISLLAESLRVSKRTVEGEGVRIRVVTDEQETPANVTLRTERIEVERVAVGRVVDAVPSVREEDGVTIIPVVEERAVTEIRLVLVEELRVRRLAETREHQQTVLLRRQRAEVDRLPATGRPLGEPSNPISTKDDQP